jgi:hypothetical protein
MNKEKIILDFAVFVLSDVEELCSYITDFFGQAFRQDSPFDLNFLNYEDYLRKEIITGDIIESPNFKSDLKSINDLLSSAELNNLKEYLNKNFREGYPDGEGLYKGNNTLDLKNSDLVRYFNAYLKYREINQNVFITYFIQLFETLNKSVSDNLKDEVEKIQNIKNTKDLLDFNLSIEYTENEHLKIKQKLFKSIKKNNFQFKGIADDKGLYFDERKTLNSYLEFLSKNEIKDFNYPSKLPNIDKSLNYLVYKYYLFVLYGKQDSTDSKVHNQQIELKEFKTANKSIVDYIESKGFNASEIDCFINTIHGGHFNDLEIRYININQVQLFHLFYYFYIFEYFENIEGCSFESENDFEKVLRLQTIIEYDKHTLNQFYKYYNNQTSHIENRHYPFKTIDKTKNKVVDILKIEEGKLKPIPKSKKY